MEGTWRVKSSEAVKKVAASARMLGQKIRKTPRITFEKLASHGFAVPPLRDAIVIENVRGSEGIFFKSRRR